MIGIDHEFCPPTFNMFFCTQPNLLLCLLYSLFDLSAMFCILLLCLLFLFCAIFQVITVLFKSTKLPQISSALSRDTIPRSEGFLPPIGSVLQTQKFHEPSELFQRCPYNRLHRDHCRCSPLESIFIANHYCNSVWPMWFWTLSSPCVPNKGGRMLSTLLSSSSRAVGAHPSHIR